MKKTLRLSENELISLIKKLISETTSNKPNHFNEIEKGLSGLGFEPSETNDSLELFWGDENEYGVSLIFYKDFSEYTLIVFSGGKIDRSTEPTKILNPKIDFKKNYKTTQISDIIYDTKKELGNLKTKMGLKYKA